MTHGSKFRRGRIAIALAAVGITPSGPVHGAVVNNLTTPAQVSFVYSYPEFGGGDVVFRLDTTLTGCEAGFWLRPTDPGFQRKRGVVTAVQAA